MIDIQVFYNGKELRPSDYVLDENIMRISMWMQLKMRFRVLFGMKSEVRIFTRRF